MKYVISAAIAAAVFATPALAAPKEKQDVTLAKCEKSIGTIAVVDGDTQGWTKFGLSSPRDLIAAMAVQSGCFSLQANNGTPADFLVNAIAGDKEEVDQGTNLAKTAVTEGIVRSGIAGKMLGSGIPFGGQALGMLGGFGGKKKTIAAGLRIISPATGQTVVTGTGEQTKTSMSIGAFSPSGLVASNPWGDAARAQMTAMGYSDPYAVGGTGSAYTQSKDGQMLATAFILAFNNVVSQQAALVAVKPAGKPAAATPIATTASYTTAIDTKLYAKAAKGVAVRGLRAGTALTPTGGREGLFVEVSDAYGTKGWVSVEDLK